VRAFFFTAMSPCFANKRKNPLLISIFSGKHFPESGNPRILTLLINKTKIQNNMKKEKTDKELVAEFITANPGTNKAAIGEGTGVKGIILHNLIKKMVNASGLTEEGQGKEATYIAAEPVAESPQVETSTDSEEGEQLPSKGRNNQKFKVNGSEPLGKGPTVREVVRLYVEEHKPTLKQLKEAFPADLLKRFGVCQDEDTARSIQGARDRYFWKEEHQIKVKGKVVVVCNQWTSENIQPFLKAARSLGFKIKAA
jgi:hypothetical protein